MTHRPTRPRDSQEGSFGAPPCIAYEQIGDELFPYWAPDAIAFPLDGRLEPEQ